MYAVTVHRHRNNVNDDNNPSQGDYSDDYSTQIQWIEKPILQPGEALIRIHYAGICNTDLELQLGYMNFQGVLGHEFVGTVIQVYEKDEKEESSSSSSSSLLINQRVCGDINLACKACSICCFANDADDNTTRSEISQQVDDSVTRIKAPKRKQQKQILARNHCPQRSVLGILNKQGTMAPYLTLPMANLHVVPWRIPNHIAVFAEPLAAALRIVEQDFITFPFPCQSSMKTTTTTASGHTIKNTPPSKIAILGDGKLGLMIANVMGRMYLQHLLLPYFSSCRGNSSNTVHSLKQSLQELSKKYTWVQTHKPTLIGKHPDKINLLKYPLVYSHHDDEKNHDDIDNKRNNNDNKKQEEDTSRKESSTSSPSSSSSSLVHRILLSECLDTSTWNGVSSKYSSQFDVVIDATGSPSGLTLASKLCKPLGILVLKSTCATGSKFNTAPFVIDELHVVGSRCGPIDQALNFLNTYYDKREEEDDEQNTYPKEEVEEEMNPTIMLRKLAPFYVDELIHGIYPLKDAVNALQFASKKQTLKVLLDCCVSPEDDGMS